MRLIHLFKYYWPDNGGGIAKAMDLVILSFKEWCRDERRKSKGQKNHQEIVVCWQNSGKGSSKDIYNETPVYRCKSLFEVASTQVSPEFMGVINKKTRNADVTIYNFPYPMVDLGILFGKVHGKLVVWWHCDFKTSKFGFLGKLYSPLVRHTLKKADKIITCAEGNINGSTLLRPFKGKCVVIPHAVSDEWAEKGERYFSSWSSTSNSGRINILFIGRFVWYKGIDILLNAYSKLGEDNKYLTLVGDGPLLDDMKELSKKLSLNNVLFTGAVSEAEKMKYIKQADFMVLPSVSEAESFAIVQIEAMSFGKPVINTRLNSGVPDVCPNEISGLTIPPCNEEELIKAMKRLSDDTDLRTRLSRGAIEYARNHYRVKHLIKLYGDLFDELSEL